MAVTQYIGARYVPVFADPAEWTNTKQYEPLTIVLHQGNSFTSKQFVPVGVDIDDTDFWAATGSYNAQIDLYRQEVLGFADDIQDVQDNVDTLRNDVAEDIQEVQTELGRDIQAVQTELSGDIQTVQNNVDNLRNYAADAYTPFPDVALYSKYGTAGQVLTTLANGKTKWENPINPTDAQAAEYIGEWLDAHPEATTTIQDGAVTKAKIADGAVIDPKLIYSSVFSEGIGNLLTGYGNVLALNGATQNGIRLTVNDHGTISTEGTATAGTDFPIYLTNPHSMPPWIGKGITYNAYCGIRSNNVHFQIIAFFSSDPTDFQVICNIKNGEKAKVKIPSNTFALWMRLHVDANATVNTSGGYIYLTRYMNNTELDSEVYGIKHGGVDYNAFNVIEYVNQAPSFTRVNNGISYEYERDGSFTANGRATPESLLELQNLIPEVDVIRGHEYTAIIETNDNNIKFQGIAYANNTVRGVPWNITGSGSQKFTLTDPSVTRLLPRLSIANGTTVSNASGKVRIMNALTNEEITYIIGNKFEPLQSGQIHFNVKVNDSNIIDTTSPTTSADSQILVDVPAVAMLPNSYTQNGKPTPLVMICHGSGYGVSANGWGQNGASNVAFTNFIGNFINAGYAVCDVNGIGSGVQSTWGCPRVIQAYRKLYEYMIAHFNVEKQINIYGFSMGGIVALNFAATNGDIVKTVALGAPVTSLFDQVYNYSKGRKESCARFYNFELPSGFTYDDFVEGPATQQELQIWNDNLSKMIGFNPYAKIRAQSSEQILSFQYPPLRIWHAIDDNSVDYTYSANFVNAIRNSDNYASIRLVSTGGHGISYGENQTITTEYMYWLNRFNNFE